MTQQTLQQSNHPLKQRAPQGREKEKGPLVPEQEKQKELESELKKEACVQF
jgi:hypothetical protein